MRSARLLAIVGRNLKRSRNHFMLASIGIVVGIATFFFFLSLGLGVREVVLGKIFPLDKLEVIPKSLDVALGPVMLPTGSDVIDDEMVGKIRALPGVETVYPKMKLTVPAVATGGQGLLGSDIRAELPADGIDPDLVGDELKPGFEFKDWEDPDNAETPVSCKKDGECADDMYCGPASMTRELAEGDKKAKKLPKDQEKVCRHYIPILVSNHILELYNGTLRRAHNFPKLNPDSVLGFKFEVEVGESFMGGTKDERIFERAMLVGFSDKAIALGVTMPIGYTRRLNVAFGAEDDAQRYHSVIVKVPSKDDVARVAHGVEQLELEVEDSGAEQAALLIAVFMMVFGAVSAVIVGIAAVNIMHVFFMLVYERQRDIGVMRAVGASRGDVAKIILGEAAVLGLAAGLAGVGLAMLAGSGFDSISANYVPDFPYKPTTYFVYPWWLFGSALAYSVGFCVLGAFLPARRAARMEPARVLSGQ